jgi:hypothetical protein
MASKTPSYSGGGNSGVLDRLFSSIKNWATQPGHLVPTGIQKVSAPASTPTKGGITPAKKSTPEPAPKSASKPSTSYDKMKAIESASKKTNVSTSKASPAKLQSPATKAVVSVHPSTPAKSTGTVSKSSGSTASKSSAPSTPSAPSAPPAPSQAELQRQAFEAQKQAILNSLKANSDAFYNNQVAQFGKTKESALADILRAYNQNLDTENQNTQVVNHDFEDQQGQINTSAFNQAQMTALLAQQNGIGNSQQMLGLQQGDAFRRDQQVQGAMTERDRRIADIQTRLANLMSQKGLDENKVNSEYDYNLASARAQADQMYNQGMTDFNTNVFNQDRTFQHDADMANLDNQLKLQQMAQQHAYSQALARASASKASVSGAGAVTKATDGLSQAYQQFQQAKSSSPIGQYNNNMAIPKPANQSVVRQWNPYPLGAPPTVANNPNLTDYAKMKMFQGGGSLTSYK